MKHYAILFAFAAILTGCSPKIYPSASTDSVRVEYRDRVVKVTDTVAVEIPQIVEKVTTRDTVSHLENAWAKSDAMVSCGELTHSLETVPHVEYVPYETYVEVHDTTYIERAAETITQIVPAELSKWQSFILVCGYIFWAAILALILAVVGELFLKK